MVIGAATEHRRGRGAAIELQWSVIVVAATGASLGPPSAAMELQWSVAEGPPVLPQSIPGATTEQ